MVISFIKVFILIIGLLILPVSSFSLGSNFSISCVTIQNNYVLCHNGPMNIDLWTISKNKKLVLLDAVELHQPQYQNQYIIRYNKPKVTIKNKKKSEW